MLFAFLLAQQFGFIESFVLEGREWSVVGMGG